MLNREHPRDPGTSVGKGREHLYCYLVGRKQGVTTGESPIKAKWLWLEIEGPGKAL